MNTESATLATAFTTAGYPAPAVTTTPAHTTLSWGTGAGRPALHITDHGDVTVRAAHTPDATFTLADDRQTADDWIALLHPVIADAIAHATDSEPAPAPTHPAHRDAVIVWLDHDEHANATYAVYTDNARIWLSEDNTLETAAALFDTPRGHQLGITPHTLVQMQSSRRGPIMINPALAYATALQTGKTWEPAITFRDPRGFIERATPLFGIPETPTTEPNPRFRDFDAPTIPLQHTPQPRFFRAADMTAAAIALLDIARRQHRRADVH